MKITRKIVVNSIIGQSQHFPNCNLIRKGNDLYIECMNGKFKKFIFKTSFKIDDEKKIKTYYETWKYLSDNPEIEITPFIEEKKLT